MYNDVGEDYNFWIDAIYVSQASGAAYYYS